MSNLIHLIYASRESVRFTRDEVVDLLKKAKENNSQVDVTGMLLYENGSFLQVLEGEEETVDEVFEKISKDLRHKNITTIIREGISSRQFGSWSMGYADIPSEELETIEGMNDFFREGKCMADLDKGRAKKIIDAFGRGRWRLG